MENFVYSVLCVQPTDNVYDYEKHHLEMQFIFQEFLF